jgi:hypothetical protein
MEESVIEYFFFSEEDLDEFSYDMVSALHRKLGTCCFRQMSEFVGVSVRLIYAGVRVDSSCCIRKNIK